MLNNTTEKKGIESLKESVISDCKGGENCFNPNGCDKVTHEYLPEDNPALVKMGLKTKCVRRIKCFHIYCDKYKWVMDRAKMYAEFTGQTVEEVIEAWEKDRSYWYMNYYQDCNQPEIKKESGMNVVKYDDWVSGLKKKFGEDAKQWKFKCPACGHIQCAQDFIDAKIENPENKVYFSCIGRWKKGTGCDWTLGGLLKINSTVVVKDMQIFPVFEMAGTKTTKKRLNKSTKTKSNVKVRTSKNIGRQAKKTVQKD